MRAAIQAACFALTAWAAFALPDDQSYSYGQGYQTAPDRYDWGHHGRSFVALIAVAENAGCPYIVRFRNAQVHSTETETLVLSRDDVEVRVTMVLGRGDTPDEMTVDAAPLAAIPEHIIVPEGQEGEVRVCHAMF